MRVPAPRTRHQVPLSSSCGKMAHTAASLAADLRALGLERGDTVFVHSSLGSVGTVDGGAAPQLLAAFDDVLGPSGLLLLPNFHLLATTEARMSEWDVATSPSTVGYFTEFARTAPGTWRSDAYSHSVAARGNRAQDYTSHHLERTGCRSPWDQEHTRWGRTFGDGMPMLRAHAEGGKLLMLGALYDTSTYLHVAECLLWRKMLACLPISAAEQARLTAAELRAKHAPFPAIDRPAMGGWWEAQGRRQLGSVGDAECRLCGIRDFADACMGEVLANPWPYLRPGGEGHAHGERVYAAGSVRGDERKDVQSGPGQAVALLRRVAAAVAKL